MIMRIKKYKNRQFYHDGKRLRLDEIENAVITGSKIKVIDMGGNDVTLQTHGKIIGRIFDISSPHYIREYLRNIGIF